MNEPGNKACSVTEVLPGPHPDLLPCPFCGEQRIFLNEPTPLCRKGSINCPACLVVMPGEVNRDELINCWNVRDTGWQAIETAPKDGEIWAFNGEHARMKWLAGDNGADTFALWIYADKLLCDVDPDPIQPTHWMPLPTPPEVQS